MSLLQGQGDKFLPVIDNDNRATALSFQILVSNILIDTVRKPSVEPIVLAKWWDNPAESTHKLEKDESMLHPWLSRGFRMNDHELFLAFQQVEKDFYQKKK